MILQDDKTKIEINILEYESIKKPLQDENEWLIIYLKIIENKKIKINRNLGGALFYEEVVELAEWLKEIALVQLTDKDSISKKYSDLDFMEPEFEFKFKGFDKNFIKIDFIFTDGKNGNNYTYHLKLSKESINLAVSELLEELKNFPNRLKKA